MAKKTWRRGRASICEGAPAITTSIQLCPEIKASLLDYCRKTGVLKSKVINHAIRDFIQSQEDKDE